MRGEAASQATMLTAVSPDALVPQSHPFRPQAVAQSSDSTSACSRTVFVAFSCLSGG